VTVDDKGPASPPPAPGDPEFDEVLELLQDEALRQAREIYSAEVIAECMAPHNLGRLDPCDGCAALTGGCGDTMEITLRVRDGVVAEIAFLTDGCGATVACGSAVTRLALGRGIEEALDITQLDILALLNGLPPNHLHCAALATETLVAALTDHLERSSATMARDEGQET
jgi:nitrogen fixation NifU-like protein